MIRCNYRAHAIALSLAKEGRVFGGLCGWKEDEVNAANAIISIRQGKSISLDQMISIINLFPAKMLDINVSKEDFVSSLEQKYTPQINTGTGILNCKTMDILNSSDPTKGMLKSSLLFRAKINGIKNRINLILLEEVKNRNILTIHGAKGLEKAS